MKNIAEIASVLKQCPDFKSLTEMELTAIAKYASPKEYSKCQEVFSFDQPGNYFYVVAEGVFHLHLRNTHTKEYGPGEIFGELAIFNDRNRTGVIKAQSPGKLISIKNDILLNSTLLSPDLRSNLIFLLSRKMVCYLQDNYESNSNDLIERGEGTTVEFKEALSDIHYERIVQSLCGFMNTQGGTVFVGIDDSGVIKGITGNVDEFRRELNEMIKVRLGGILYRSIHFDVEKIQGKKILRIDCQPADRPVYYKYPVYVNQKAVQKEKFLVRNDSVNKNLKDASEVIRYFEKRFGCA